MRILSICIIQHKTKNCVKFILSLKILSTPLFLFFYTNLAFCKNLTFLSKFFFDYALK